MSPTDGLPPSRRSRFGLEGKLFALLVLLGAAVVLITGGLGYVRSHDSLEEAIYNQLTIARKNKARQVETYFRTIRGELVQLAATQMVATASKGFSAAYAELDQSEIRPEIRRSVDDWYASQLGPQMRRLLGKEPNIDDYLPTGAAAYHLQYHYIVSNPYTVERRKFLDNAGDDSSYSRQHAVSHPLLRAAAASFGFFDLLLVDPRSGRVVYAVAKEVDLGAPWRPAHSGSPISPPPLPAALQAPTDRQSASRTSHPMRLPQARRSPSWRPRSSIEVR